MAKYEIPILDWPEDRVSEVLPRFFLIPHFKLKSGLKSYKTAGKVEKTQIHGRKWYFLPKNGQNMLLRYWTGWQGAKVAQNGAVTIFFLISRFQLKSALKSCKTAGKVEKTQIHGRKWHFFAQKWPKYATSILNW